ncbi:MAG: hypothetical protein WCV69_00095 [Patescibacteria group bacterium]|jgi:hypothetical protein
MTKYIVNSGGSLNNPQGEKLSIEETLKGLGEKPNVLFCFFAQKREDWETDFKVRVVGFEELMPDNVKPHFELAFPEKFVEQINQADAVVIFGGDDHLVQYWLKQFDIPNIWDGKVVSIRSASSNALAKYFWTCDWRKCMDGLGILAIKLIPHYKSNYGIDDPRGAVDWDEAYKELAEYGDKNMVIHALKEGEFIVIEQ